VKFNVKLLIVKENTPNVSFYQGKDKKSYTLHIHSNEFPLEFIHKAEIRFIAYLNEME
jgi:hypothetical protein